MTLKQKDVERLFVGKLKAFRKVERTKHIAFELVDERNKMPLPPLTMSRGSGDVGLQICRGLSSTLGVTREGFEKGTQCHVGASCFWLCLAAKMLQDRCNECRRDPNVFNDEWMAAAAKTVGSLLTRAETERGTKPWNKLEIQELRGAKERLTGSEEIAHMNSASANWTRIAGAI